MRSGGCDGETACWPARTGPRASRPNSNQICQISRAFGFLPKPGCLAGASCARRATWRAAGAPIHVQPSPPALTRVASGSRRRRLQVLGYRVVAGGEPRRTRKARNNAGGASWRVARQGGRSWNVNGESRFHLRPAPHRSCIRLRPRGSECAFEQDVNRRWPLLTAPDSHKYVSAWRPPPPIGLAYPPPLFRGLRGMPARRDNHCQLLGLD